MKSAVRSTRLRNAILNIVLLTVSSVACFLINEFVLRALGYHGVVSSNGGFNPAGDHQS